MSPQADAYRYQTVAVTGATGFVGQYLVRRLLTHGAKVVVLVRNTARLPADLALQCRVVNGDLLDIEALNAMLEGATYLFHCAANVATWGPWQTYAKTNVEGVRALLAAVTQNGSSLKRLVHLSTLDVYGFPVLPADESTVLRKVAYGYGESKRLGDLAVQENGTHTGLSYVVLRPGNIVGPRSPFVSRIGKALRDGWMLTVDEGLHHAGLLDIENLVDVMLWAGMSTQAHQQVYNVRDPWDICWADYLRDVQSGLHAHGKVIDLPYGMVNLLAHSYAAPFLWAAPTREPALHPLIVQIFGKTCGHSIEKLKFHGAAMGRINYQSSLRRSLEWFVTQDNISG